MNRHIIRLLRPHQWLKNVFVFTPLFFSGHAAEWRYVWPCVIAFLAFCMVASGIYCFNDIYDAEADRLHPVKQKRPLASGAVSKPTAYIVMGTAWLLAFALIVLTAILDGSRQMILAATLFFYIVMNIAYCVKLKQIAILDVTIIAIGFVMRVLIGGLTTDIWISHWLVMMTFLLTLFLALAKRNDDYRIYEQTGMKPRISITGYNQTFINEATAIIASVTMVCYIMYTMSPEVIQRWGTRYVYLTSGWVLAGLLRYLQNMIVYGLSGSPTKSMVKDRFIQLCMLGWIASFFAIIYL